MPKDLSKITYTTSLNKNLVRRFKVQCTLEGRYQNEVLEQLIQEYLDKVQNKEGEGDGNTNR